MLGEEAPGSRAGAAIGAFPTAVFAPGNIGVERPGPAFTAPGRPGYTVTGDVAPNDRWNGPRDAREPTPPMSLMIDPSPTPSAATPPGQEGRATRPAGIGWRVALALSLLAGSAAVRFWQSRGVDEMMRRGSSAPSR